MGVYDTMTNEYRLEMKRETSARSVFRTMAGILAIAACVVVCITAWPDPAVYGTDTPDTEGQQLRMLRFESAGPVQIEVTDPEGNTVSRDMNQIDGAVFFDGDRQVVIEIPHSTVGDYELHVNVTGSANRLQLFDAWVTDGVDTIQFADRELIVNVPVDPYVIRNDHDGFAIATVAVDDGSPEGSGNLIWILAGAAVLLAGVVVVIIRSRRRKR